MNRDEVIQLLILEADGGLDPADRLRLETQLRRDPGLASERDRIRTDWNTILCSASSLKYTRLNNQGVRELMRRRPEGLLIGTPIRIAAAFFITAAILRAVVGPAAVGTSTVQVAGGPTIAAVEEKTAIGVGDILTASSGNTTWADFHGGSSIGVHDGAFRIAGLSRLAAVSSSFDVQVAFGARTMTLKLGDSVVSGQDARFQVIARPSGEVVNTHLEVEEGCVRVQCPGGSRLVRAGETLKLGGNHAAASPVLKVEETVPLPEPERQLEPVETPDVDESDSESDDSAGAKVDGAEAYGKLLGRLHVPEAVSPAGTTVRLTRVAAIREPLLETWQGDGDRWPVQRLAELERLDRRLEQWAYHRTLTEDGIFAFPMVRSGTYRFEVLVARKSPLGDAPVHYVRIRPGKTQTTQVATDFGRTLQGVVTDKHGRAIEGARVSSATRETRTSEVGRFVICGATAETTLAVQCHGYLSRQVHASQVGSLPITLRRGEPVEVELLNEIRARVIDAEVEALWMNRGKLARCRFDYQSWDDRFVSTEVNDGVPYLLRIRPAGELPFDVWISKPETRCHSVRLMPSFQRRLRLVDSEGGFPAADVEAIPTTGATSAVSDEAGSMRIRSQPEGTSGFVFVSEQGRWEYVELELTQSVVAIDPPTLQKLDVRSLPDVAGASEWGLWVLKSEAGQWLKLNPATVNRDGWLVVPDPSENMVQAGLEFVLLYGGDEQVAELSLLELHEFMSDFDTSSASVIEGEHEDAAESDPVVGDSQRVQSDL